MPWLLTDAGAKKSVDLMTGVLPQSGGDFAKFMYLLAAPPPIDRTKISLTDYTLVTDVIPSGVELLPGAASPAGIIGGRATAQWGPPAYDYVATADVTVWGIVVADQFDVVWWFDRFPLQRDYLSGTTIQVIPAIAGTSECPPLGGCT